MTKSQSGQNVPSPYFIPNVSLQFINYLKKVDVAWKIHTSPIHETGVLISANPEPFLKVLGLVILSKQTFPQALVEDQSERNANTDDAVSIESKPDKPENSLVHRVVLWDPRPIEEIQQNGSYFTPPPIQAGNERMAEQAENNTPLYKVIQEKLTPGLNIKIKLYFVDGGLEHSSNEYFSINILGVRWQKEDRKLVVPERIWDIPTGRAQGTPCHAPQGGELIIFSDKILPLAALDNNQHLYIHFDITKMDEAHSGDLMGKILDRVRLGIVDPKAYEAWIRETLYDESFRQYLSYRAAHRAQRIESAYQELLAAEYSHADLLHELRRIEASLNEKELLLKVHRRQSELLRAKFEADLPNVWQMANVDKIKTYPENGTLAIFLKNIARENRLLGNFVIYLYQPLSTQPWIRVFNLQPTTRPVIGTTHAPNILANGSFADPNVAPLLLRSIETDGLSSLVGHVIRYLSVGNVESRGELDLLQYFPQVDETAAPTS